MEHPMDFIKKEEQSLGFTDRRSQEQHRAPHHFAGYVRHQEQLEWMEENGGPQKENRFIKEEQGYSPSHHMENFSYGGPIRGMGEHDGKQNKQRSIKKEEQGYSLGGHMEGISYGEPMQGMGENSGRKKGKSFIKKGKRRARMPVPLLPQTRPPSRHSAIIARQLIAYEVKEKVRKRVADKEKAASKKQPNIGRLQSTYKAIERQLTALLKAQEEIKLLGTATSDHEQKLQADILILMKIEKELELQEQSQLWAMTKCQRRKRKLQKRRIQDKIQRLGFAPEQHTADALEAVQASNTTQMFATSSSLGPVIQNKCMEFQLSIREKPKEDIVQHKKMEQERQPGKKQTRFEHTSTNQMLKAMEILSIEQKAKQEPVEKQKDYVVNANATPGRPTEGGLTKDAIKQEAAEELNEVF